MIESKAIYDNYIIYSDGRLWSKRRNIYIKPHDPGKGYLQYRMKVGRGYVIKLAHRLVAESFIPNPEHKKTVNHKNRIKNDNRIENLEWCTQSEQMFHALSMGFRPNTTGIGKPGLESGKSRPVTNGVKTYVSLTDASRDGFNRTLISQVCRGLSKAHKGFKWSFVDKEDVKC